MAQNKYKTKMVELNIDSLSRLTVPELQQELKKRGLKKSGVKCKLIQRLSEHLQKYGTEVVNITPQHQPNYASKEIPESLEESFAIQNVIYEETESVHVAEELANSIHKSPTSQEYGTRKISIDSDITDEARNNNEELNASSLMKLEKQEEDGGNDFEEKLNDEENPVEKESSITDVLHVSEENLSCEKETGFEHETNNSDNGNTKTITNNAEEGEQFQYDDETNESDQKLLIEEVNDSSKELDKNVFPTHVTEEITYETSIDEGEIVSEEDEGVATEDKIEKSKKKTVKPVPLKKRVSLQAIAESTEEKAAKRKRRWGSTSKDASNQSSESIKKLVTDVKLGTVTLDDQPELDYQEDDERDVGAPNTNKRRVKVDSGKIISLGKRANPEVLVVEDAGEKSALNSVETGFAKPTYVDEDNEVQEKRERSPSPARNPVSCYIHITGLVRPFTVNQLKVLIGRTGTISENGFWINQVKSHCYVQLSSEEQAASTRHALHGLKWPSGTPKILKVDFATNSQMWEDTQGVMGRQPKIVIEIDDKDEEKRVKKTSKETEKRDRTKDSKRKDGENRKEKKREESPAKLLDDLFRKTKATPCIYWLPLTDEEILNREKKNLTENTENLNASKVTSKENNTSRRPRSLNRPVRGWR